MKNHRRLAARASSAIALLAIAATTQIAVAAAADHGSVSASDGPVVVSPQTSSWD